MTQPRRITGTHVYSFVKCPRLAALDLSRDRAERRPPAPWEEFAAQRGRDLETRIVGELSATAPSYPERDFAAGAAATLALLREGAPLVHQGVLASSDERGDRLGMPDLLRKVDGASALGGHHYEVLDVKSSGRPRGDQILQVVFYSRLLAAVQQREPTHGALVLKDGREERFAIADYAAAEAEVETELERLRERPESARAFRQGGCDSCHWNHRCLPELEAKDDLSLVQGMSHGARAILESLGCRTAADLAVFTADGGRARGHLDATLVRRLRRAAQARLLGEPIAEARPRALPLDPAAVVTALVDPFADRVLAFGVLAPAAEDGAFSWVRPRDRAEEWAAFRELLGGIAPRANLLHFGEQLPRWYEENAFAREAQLGWSARFVDLQRRLRGAALYPGPVFGLADFVRHGLGRDPLRAGHPMAAATWLGEPDRDERLRGKLHADALDLAALKAKILDAEPAPEAAEPALP